jgi:hypothetical protein
MFMGMLMGFSVCAIHGLLFAFFGQCVCPQCDVDKLPVAPSVRWTVCEGVGEQSQPSCITMCRALCIIPMRGLQFAHAMC